MSVCLVLSTWTFVEFSLIPALAVTLLERDYAQVEHFKGFFFFFRGGGYFTLQAKPKGVSILE